MLLYRILARLLTACETSPVFHFLVQNDTSACVRPATKVTAANKVGESYFGTGHLMHERGSGVGEGQGKSRWKNSSVQTDTSGSVRPGTKVTTANKAGESCFGTEHLMHD